MAAYELLKAIEVEDEEGNTTILTVKRLITQDPEDARATFSNELIFRPGGGAIAKRKDDRIQTIADDSIADAFHRERQETDRLRQQGMTHARTGGEGGIQPDQERQGPQRRPPRGSSRSGTPASTPAAPAAAPVIETTTT